MSAQFTLAWNNADVLANANATGQRALLRRRDVGGTWLSADFTPANDLTTADVTVDTPDDLVDNVVYQFKVQCLCAVGGPIDNDNGIVEMIHFLCIDPTLDQSDTEASASIDLTGTNITKVKFTLRKSSTDIIVASTIVNRVANAASLIVSAGLLPDTNYYWEITYYATVNNVEVLSSSVSFLGAVCNYPITTDELSVCTAVASLTVTSIELI